jgi:hypothetical protein
MARCHGLSPWGRKKNNPSFFICKMCFSVMAVGGWTAPKLTGMGAGRLVTRRRRRRGGRRRAGCSRRRRSRCARGGTRGRGPPCRWRSGWAPASSPRPGTRSTTPPGACPRPGLIRPRRSWSRRRRRALNRRPRYPAVDSCHRSPRPTWRRASRTPRRPAARPGSPWPRPSPVCCASIASCPHRPPLPCLMKKRTRRRPPPRRR